MYFVKEALGTNQNRESLQGLRENLGRYACAHNTDPVPNLSMRGLEPSIPLQRHCYFQGLHPGIWKQMVCVVGEHGTPLELSLITPSKW